MLKFSDGHLYGLYKNSNGIAWFGSLSYIHAGLEHIPMTIGNERLMLEFVMPTHLIDATSAPRYIITGINKHYLLRRNYREIKLYRVNKYGVMEIIRDEDSLLFQPELSPAFVSLVQKAVCYYATLTPETNQFIFEAQGKYSLLIAKSLTRIDSELQCKFNINPIEELRPPFFGFELESIK